ncbi:MAG: hypothetical protein IJF97_04060 [Eggerthellaceae bacterium]|nr:hypothetical protein [Eggerthellaceae bacterium]
MRITFNAQTALLITRTLRANRVDPAVWGKRIDLIPPDPSPGKRFTKKLFDMPHLGLALTTGKHPDLDIAVPGKELRLRMNGAHNTIYGSTRSLPPHSFIEVDDGIAISCPELIFLEMVDVMPLMRLVMLGHELCGTFSRDPHDPRNGEATLSCPPLTSCERIEAFIRETKWNAHAEQALRALSLVSDNAWSPTESIVAAVASLPYEEWGYGFGRCILNKRIDTSTGLALATGKDSRRPDILFEGTPVGLNYDGAIHLDLDAVAKAAMELERNPGEAANQQAFDAIMHEVRSKAVDDIRRNRELASAGYIVFPVTKEDLYEEGALDTVMLQVMKTIENLTGKDLSREKRLLEIRFCRGKRQELIWSVLPGEHPRHSKNLLGVGEPRVYEVMVGF